MLAEKLRIKIGWYSAGMMNVTFKQFVTDLSDDDYFYMILYSMLYDLPVPIEKFGVIILMMLGQSLDPLHNHDIFLTLAYGFPELYQRILYLLSNEPNYFSNCQIESVSAKGCYRTR